MVQSIIQPKDVTLFKHPLLAFSLLGEVILIKLKQLYSFSQKNKFIILFMVATFVSVNYIDQLRTIKEIGWIVFYWIMLGVASSIGLGTGLHTFVLYLGPHIAKVVVASIDCGHVPEMVPSRWNFQYFQGCRGDKTGEVSILQLVAAVQIEAFLWGLGTALGELPPYFISKKASVMEAELKEYERNQNDQNKAETIELKRKVSEAEEEVGSLKEIEELEKLQAMKWENLSLLQKLKKIFFELLRKHGFITVLMLASIPNPLFDLAGILCGRFKIPFWTFFLATFIGKAIIKVHIQVFFIIFLFSERHVEKLLQLIQKLLPFLQNKLVDTLERQKQQLFEPETFKASKPFVGRLWDLFLWGMIGYFVLSIVNSEIKHHLIVKRREEAKSQKELEKTE